MARYSKGSQGKGGGGNPHMTDSPGPRDGLKAMDYNRADVGTYKSNESKGSAVAGVRDTNGGATRELKRSTPVAGVYQSGNNDRGGAATKNYDRPLGKYDTYEAEGLKELRRQQDSRSKTSQGSDKSGRNEGGEE